MIRRMQEKRDLLTLWRGGDGFGSLPRILMFIRRMNATLTLQFRKNCNLDFVTRTDTFHQVLITFLNSILFVSN